MSFILASNSPRRKQLLADVVKNFIVVPAREEEVVKQGLSPELIASSLAEQKCDEVFSTHPFDTVLGCDTVVAFRGQILGKPKSAEEAVQTLTALSGNIHHVITGVCLQRQGRKLVRYAVTEVQFNHLSQDFILSYVQSGSPMDKAGSYGIQDGGLVAHFTGSYTNVVGLPVELITTMLKELGEVL